MASLNRRRRVGSLVPRERVASATNGSNRTMLVLTLVCAVAATGSLFFAWREWRKPSAEELARHERDFRRQYGALSAAERRAEAERAQAVTAPDDPIAALEERLRRQMDAAGEANERGLDLVASNDIALALEEFRRATRHDPSGVDGWLNLGGAALASDDLLLAREAFQRAVDLAPDRWLTHYNQAHLFVLSGQLDAALASLVRAAATAPTSGPEFEPGGLLDGARADFRDKLDLPEFRDKPEYETVLRVFGDGSLR